MIMTRHLSDRSVRLERCCIEITEQNVFICSKIRQNLLPLFNRGSLTVKTVLEILPKYRLLFTN